MPFKKASNTALRVTVAQDVNDRVSPVLLSTLTLNPAQQLSKLSQIDIQRVKKERDRIAIANKRAAQRTAESGKINGVFGLSDFYFCDSHTYTDGVLDEVDRLNTEFARNHVSSLHKRLKFGTEEKQEAGSVSVALKSTKSQSQFEEDLHGSRQSQELKACAPEEVEIMTTVFLANGSIVDFGPKS
jgi:hypothetical protein